MGVRVKGLNEGWGVKEFTFSFSFSCGSSDAGVASSSCFAFPSTFLALYWSKYFFAPAANNKATISAC